MMRQIVTLIKAFTIWTGIGLFSKILFLFIYHSLIPSLMLEDWIAVLQHGLRLDIAIAGYLSIVPGLILIISAWYVGRICKWIWNGYHAVVALLVSLAYVSNIGLYGYWGYPLDSTPLLYVTTSPSAALASMTTWQLFLVPAAVIAMAAVIYCVFARIGRNAFRPCSLSLGSRMTTTLLMLLLTASMIIPIRGGFGTGTNHTGSVYFSDDIRKNHAAVNPVFSFVESVLHHEEIATRYRFMDEDKAARLFEGLIHTKLRPDAVRNDYNVVIICLESFSKYIMTESGHVEGVTPNLDRYSNEGLYFTNFYANTFRTDRALVSILSGLPAQPTMSVMDMPRISTSLPSLARTLGREGYSTHFYYGGDTNYSNMKSYLVGTGFQQITAQYDFRREQSTGKWGVADGAVFEKLFEDIKNETADTERPFFKAFMTGSSHEPFDVPDYKKKESPELNAFSYTDNCLGTFMEKLRKLPCWERTIVVLVPDHLGAYPLQIDNYQRWRYDIPLIIMGGMIKEPRKVDVVGSQIDICATLLGMLGMAHDDFIYSKDLLDSNAPHFAFFSFPDAVGMREEDNYMVYDNLANSVLVREGVNPEALLPKAKAYLQKLYDDLGSR